MTEPLKLPHPRALAHLGDAVYELFIREEAVAAIGDQQPDALHRYTTERVRASYQAHWLQHWLATAHLSDTEQDWLRRGRNLPVTTRRRMDQGVYRQATAFEVLIGWLYQHDQNRLNQLLAIRPSDGAEKAENLPDS